MHIIICQKTGLYKYLVTYYIIFLNIWYSHSKISTFRVNIVGQRAPQQQLSRCLEDGTRIDLSLSEISDEEVDYGSSASNANSDTAPDSSWTPLFKKR